MEFYENRAKRPFIAFVWIGKTVKQWYRVNRTRRILRQMSDEQLKDVGLSRYDVCRGQRIRASVCCFGLCSNSSASCQVRTLL